MDRNFNLVNRKPVHTENPRLKKFSKLLIPLWLSMFKIRTKEKK